MALCAIAYLYVFPYFEPLNNPNENARFYMTAALVEEGTYVVDGMRARWGWVNDCAIYEGRAYSVKAPGSSFLGVPAYFAYFHGSRLIDRPFDRTEALWACRVFGSILPWLVFLFYFYRWLGRRAASGLARDAVFVSIALGSCLYGYGLLFASHTLSAAAAFGAFMLLSDAKRAARITEGRAFVAGLLTAGVTLLEYPGFVVSAVLAVYALFAIRSRRLLIFAAGALVPTLAMMHFQWSCFGSPFSPGHRYVESDAFRAAHHEGFFGAVGWQWDAIYGLLVHPGAGLWPLTPILLFAIPGLVLAWRRARAEALASTLIVLLTVASIAVMNNWRGGWTIGPRYLAVVYPFLGWGALVGLAPIDRRWPSLSGMLALGTTAAAIALSALPSAYYPHYPPEIDRPLTQVVALLFAHDYAPYNAAHFLGVHGSASMWPLGLLLIAALLW
ncbi:MAG: hypothetical protein K8H88_04730, partial [Sandaracinaceae bacterium]|nr:hypothetical protein [Sandaracinaceae bacterium]